MPHITAHVAEVSSGPGPLPLFGSGLLHETAHLKAQTPIPQRLPEPGEQYRFHFDMSKCIGCKCCVVACNEQNGNPAAIHWRRVGELEGGYYPYAQRYHLSMGCNHCLEPSCLIGCPVEAYTKDPATGAVIHSADACIGCQYCTWNCVYGAPQYNRERGVVGKCDLCHNRLLDGMAPACVAACPEGAIAIEIAGGEEWRRDYVAANAPGLPSAGDSISTTRITLPSNLLPDTGRVDTDRVRPEAPHWPLVFMLVLTQLSVGAFAALWILGRSGFRAAGLWPAIAAFAAAAIGLGVSTLHLGRPVYAWRAFRGLRRSWLSREALALSGFTGIAAFCALLQWLHASWSGPACAAVLCGSIGIMCSARIYMVPARPAWHSGYTMAEFFSTAVQLGALFAWAVSAPDASWLPSAAAAGAAAQWLTQILKFLWLSRSERFELRGSALLLSARFQGAFLIRLGLLTVAGITLPLSASSHAGAVAALALAFTSECLGRWLFFVSVVPKNIAATFLAAERIAA